MLYIIDRKEFWVSDVDRKDLEVFFKITLDPVHLRNSNNMLRDLYGFKYRPNKGMEYGYHFEVIQPDIFEPFYKQFKLWKSYKRLKIDGLQLTLDEAKGVKLICVDLTNKSEFEKVFNLRLDVDYLLNHWNYVCSHKNGIRYANMGMEYGIGFHFIIKDIHVFCEKFEQLLKLLEDKKTETITEPKVEKSPKEEKYVWESKRDQLYHENWVGLSDAITKAGGNPIFVLEKAESFLDTCARNGIKLTAKHEHD